MKISSGKPIITPPKPGTAAPPSDGPQEETGPKDPGPTFPDKGGSGSGVSFPQIQRTADPEEVPDPTAFGTGTADLAVGLAVDPEEGGEVAAFGTGTVGLAIDPEEGGEVTEDPDAGGEIAPFATRVHQLAGSDPEEGGEVTFQQPFAAEPVALYEEPASEIPAAETPPPEGPADLDTGFDLA